MRTVTLKPKGERVPNRKARDQSCGNIGVKRLNPYGATNMAFAVHVNMERCTGCNNCVVACPVNALELFTVNPASTDKIYKVINGAAISLDVKYELCAGCGICVDACPYDVIQLSGQPPQAVEA